MVARPHWRLSQELRTLPAKVVLPDIAARVEERRDLASGRVKACEVRAFVAIAVAASQREIVQMRRATVLLSDDVIQVEREFCKRFREAQYSQRSLARRRTACSVT